MPGRGSLHAVLLALAEKEMPRDFERVRVDLDEGVVHHAGGIVASTRRIEPRAMGHRTGLDSSDLHHLLRGDH
jgi:hypothetical protein